MTLLKSSLKRTNPNAGTRSWSRQNVNIAVEIVRRTRPALLSMIGGNRRTCIFCTRVACGVFSRLGIANRPLPVSLTVLNPALRRRVLGTRPGDPENENEELLYRIGTDEDLPLPANVVGKGWSGHLICVVENRLILDLSIDQVNRPQYGIHFDAAVVEPPEDQMRKFLADPDAELVGEANRCLVTYRRLNDRGYLNAGDWDRQNTRDAVVGICEAIEDSLRIGRWPSFFTREKQ